MRVEVTSTGEVDGFTQGALDVRNVSFDGNVMHQTVAMLLVEHSRSVDFLKKKGLGWNYQIVATSV